MDELLQQLDTIASQIALNFQVKDAILVAIGALLLIFGRKLYWLALAGLGFAVALHLSRQFLAFDNGQQEIAVGLVAGLFGGVLAVVAQQLAVRFAGIVLGAWGTYYAIRILVPDSELLAFFLAVIVCRARLSLRRQAL